MDCRLLPSERNQMLDAIVARGMNPSEFEWKDMRIDDDLCSRLKHSPSEFYFLGVPGYDGGRDTVISPGFGQRVERHRSSDWTEQLDLFEQWLGKLRLEVTQGDRWSVYADAQLLVDSAAGESRSDSKRFTRDQQKELKARIDQMRMVIAGLPGRTAEQLAEAHAKLDYLLEASKRQTRADFRFTAIGLLATIGTSMAMNGAEAQQLFQPAGLGLRVIGTD